MLYFIINISSLICHIIILYQCAISLHTRWIISTMFDLSISAITLLMLLLTGNLLIRSIKFAFTGKSQRIIIRRTCFIALSTGFIYFLRAMIPIISLLMHKQDNYRIE